MEVLNNLIEKFTTDIDSNNNSSSIIKDVKNLREDLNKKSNSFTNSLKDWKVTIHFLNYLSQIYDFKDVKANGYRSINKINLIAINRINKLLSENQILNLEKCLNLCLVLLKLNEKLILYYLNNQNDEIIDEFKSFISKNETDIDIINKFNCFLNKQIKNDESSNLLFKSTDAIDFFDFYFNLEKDLIQYYRYHSFFFFNDSLRSSTKFANKFFSILSNFPKSLNLLFDKDKQSIVLAKTLNNPTLTWPFSVLDQIDNSFYNDIFIPLKHFNSNVQSSTIYITRQNKIILNDLDECMEKNEYFTFNENCSFQNNLTKDDKVRIKLLKSKSGIKKKVVMFHAHGGAFVFQSPDCHEVYLREFIREIPELVIFSVDYSIRKKYPKGQQDILDAYLWLTSGLNEVKEVLGFLPEKIIFCGDSAGSFLNFSLLHLITDLNKFFNQRNFNQRIPLPNSIISFYGFYTLINISPSLFISCLDSFLTLAHIRIAFGSLIFGVEKPKFMKRILLPQFVNKKDRWYFQSNNESTNEKILNIFTTVPYLNPYKFFDFDSVKIPLYLITTEFDVCLDQNISLAHKWKGKVNLKVFNDLIHGFLQLEQIDKNVRNGISESIDLIKDAITNI